jgi:hypothetical protein
LPALVHVAAAAVDVEQQFGIVKLLGERGGGLHRRLLVAGEEQHHVAAGLEALALELDQRGDEGRHVELVVARAAAEQIAVLDHRRERIALPIGGLGLDHVHMPRDQDRLGAVPGLAGAAIARDQKGGVAELLDADIGIGEPAGDELGLEPGRIVEGLVARPGDAAKRDAALEQVERLRLGLRIALRVRRTGGERHCEENREVAHEAGAPIRRMERAKGIEPSS